MTSSFLSRLHERIAVILATGFGIGYLLPIGQGTIASAVAILPVPWMILLPWWMQSAFILVVTAIGIHTSNVAERSFQTKDDHRIVIDEIASIFITFAFIAPDQLSFPLVIVGLFLNRALDILKPFGINALQKLPSGWGVMCDDLAVGVLCRIILAICLAVGLF